MKSNFKKILLVSLLSICGTGTALAATQPALAATQAAVSFAPTIPTSNTITGWYTFAHNLGWYGYVLGTQNVPTCQQVYNQAIKNFPNMTASGKSHFNMLLNKQYVDGYMSAQMEYQQAHNNITA